MGPNDSLNRTRFADRLNSGAGLMENFVTAEIRTARSSDEIALCYTILAELRPHLRETDFVETIKRLSESTGFKLAYLIDGNAKAVAGYRVSEWLHSGKYLEIEDFITSSADRSKGYGRQLFGWLVTQAGLEGCCQLRLVSGVKRTDAHRFYERQGMVHEAQYFSLNLSTNGGGRTASGNSSTPKPLRGSA